jgi:hypothetical protein
MDENAPRPPRDEPAELPGTPMPNPHGVDPTPPPQEGLRPEADPSVVRPMEEEEYGPYGQLIPTAGLEAREEARGSDDPEAEALLEQMGVEEEGIESGQILGLVLAVLLSVAALTVVLIYLIYIPYNTQVSLDAEAAARSVDLEALEVEALARLQVYSRVDSVYGVPIDRAMALVAADYADATPAQALDIPDTYAEWNTAPVTKKPSRAVQVQVERGPLTAPVPETGLETGPLNPSAVPGTRQEAERPFRPDVPTGEEVGIDEPEDDFDPID